MGIDRVRVIRGVLEKLVEVKSAIDGSLSKAESLLFIPGNQSVDSKPMPNRSPTTDNLKLGAPPVYECSICHVPPDVPVVTQCGHLFCQVCLQKTNYPKGIQSFKRCPVCYSIVVNNSEIRIRARGDRSGQRVEIAVANHQSYESLKKSKALLSRALDSTDSTLKNTKAMM